MSTQERKVLKNKSVAPVQITAEQLLREAVERLPGEGFDSRKWLGSATETKGQYLQRSRQNFESKIQKNRSWISIWIKYANFEEENLEIAKSRSVFERAIDVEPRNIVLWLKYSEMELRQKNVNLARNVLNRAISILPRVDQFWYKLVYIEEKAENIESARNTFSRWISWEPPEVVWKSFIKFEHRHKSWQNIEEIYSKFLRLYNTCQNWISFVNFLESQGKLLKTRKVFHEAINNFQRTNSLEPSIFIEFAKFEIRCKEYERARAVFKYGLNYFGKNRAEGLYHSYLQFEKKYGDEDSISDALFVKKISEYEKEINTNPMNYDNWFEYIWFLERKKDITLIRHVYEKAIANTPLTKNKESWKRYIYFWLFYAIFEELTCKDRTRAINIIKTAIDVARQHNLLFSKLWIYLAHIYFRDGQLQTCRKIYGKALGISPKPKLFTSYINFEFSLKEFDRCRMLYQKFITFNPSISKNWIKYAELEWVLGETKRCFNILHFAKSQSVLDRREFIWKVYIDYLCDFGKFEEARLLYEELLDITEHVKIWISYANFEAQAGGTDSISLCKNVIKRALLSMEAQKLEIEKSLIKEAWKEIVQIFFKEKNIPSSEELSSIFDDNHENVHDHRELILKAKDWKSNQII